MNTKSEWPASSVLYPLKIKSLRRFHWIFLCGKIQSFVTEQILEHDLHTGTETSTSSEIVKNYLHQASSHSRKPAVQILVSSAKTVNWTRQHRTRAGNKCLGVYDQWWVQIFVLFCRNWRPRHWHRFA